jgi:hypothetical protein
VSNNRASPSKITTSEACIKEGAPLRHANNTPSLQVAATIETKTRLDALDLQSLKTQEQMVIIMEGITRLEGSVQTLNNAISTHSHIRIVCLWNEKFYCR